MIEQYARVIIASIAYHFVSFVRSFLRKIVMVGTHRVGEALHRMMTTVDMGDDTSTLWRGGEK